MIENSENGEEFLEVMKFIESSLMNIWRTEKLWRLKFETQPFFLPGKLYSLGYFRARSCFVSNRACVCLAVTWFKKILRAIELWGKFFAALQKSGVKKKQDGYKTVRKHKRYCTFPTPPHHTDHPFSMIYRYTCIYIYTCTVVGTSCE